MLALLTLKIGKGRMLKVTANLPEQNKLYHQECSFAIVYGGDYQDDSDSFCDWLRLATVRASAYVAPPTKNTVLS